jgi:hypothetical protein
VDPRKAHRSQEVTYLSVDTRVGGDNVSLDGVTKHVLRGKSEIPIHATVDARGRGNE